MCVAVYFVTGKGSMKDQGGSSPIYVCDACDGRLNSLVEAWQYIFLAYLSYIVS